MNSLSTLREITGLSRQQAQLLLQQADGNLELAISLHFSESRGATSRSNQYEERQQLRNQRGADRFNQQPNVLWKILIFLKKAFVEDQPVPSFLRFQTQGQIFFNVLRNHIRVPFRLKLHFGTFQQNQDIARLNQEMLFVIVCPESHIDHPVISQLLSSNQIAYFSRQYVRWIGNFNIPAGIRGRMQGSAQGPAILITSSIMRNSIIKSVQLSNLSEKQILIQLIEGGLGWKRAMARRMGIGGMNENNPRVSHEGRRLLLSVKDDQFKLQRLKQDVEYSKQIARYQEKTSAAQKQQQIIVSRKKRRSQMRARLEDHSKAADRIQFEFKAPIKGVFKRYFRQSETIEKLFEFVECQQQIEFQEERREFDLIEAYPFKSLKPLKAITIAQVFPGQTYQKLIIKEQ